MLSAVIFSAVSCLFIINICRAEDYQYPESLTDLSLLSSGRRIEYLENLNSEYHVLSNDYGVPPILSSNVRISEEGDLLLLMVWRPLTPVDLTGLIRAGLWPSGWSPDRNHFVAIVENPELIDGISSLDFIKQVEVFKPQISHGVTPYTDWSGYFLIRTLSGYDEEIREHLPWAEKLRPGLWRMAGSESDLAEIAATRGVVRISRENRRYPDTHQQFQVDDSRQIVSCAYVWEYFTGNNVLAGVLDTGVWSSHPDLSGAVVSGPPDADGHGTAVCGVIASRGTRPLSCKFKGRGVAYNSDLYVLERPETMTSGDFDNLLNQFNTAGAPVVNNSWGFTSPGYDDFCYVADDWVNQGMLLIFSAGNDGSPGSINSPGLAKNVITAGAVTYVPDDDGICLLAPYSSQGPTPGSGRLKPDVVAPGGAFEGSVQEYGVVTTNASYGGDWLDDPQDRWPEDPYYTRVAGTSMAAAHVTGAIALCIDKYEEQVSVEELISAIIASAVPLKGNTGPPESGYATTGMGYGMIDAMHIPGSYFTEEVDRPIWILDTYYEGTLQEDWTFYIPENRTRLSVALAYADVPGEETAGLVSIRNNLNLMLISPSSTQYEYVLPAGITDESPFEKICVEFPEKGLWTARVIATAWSDPGNPFEREDYSVAAYLYGDEPNLHISKPNDTTYVASPGTTFGVRTWAKNDGGFVSFGTYCRIEAPEGFGGEVSIPIFFDNLTYNQGHYIDTLMIDAPEATGTYTLWTYIDAANLGIAPDSASFTVIIGYPDLVPGIPGPDILPPYSPGDSINITVVAMNQGVGPVYNYILRLYLTEDPESREDTIAVFNGGLLRGGWSHFHTAPYKFTYQDAGTRYIVATIDEEDQIPESDENNNISFFGPFLVTGAFVPPQNLTAESGHDGIIPLSWQPPGGKGLTGYNLYRSTDQSGPDPDPIATFPVNVTTYIDSLVNNGTTYYYWATGLYQNPDGESYYSNMASATPQGPSGSLGGRIWDTFTGRNLESAEIIIEDLGISGFSDEDGIYLFEDAPVGRVPLRVELDGYVTEVDTADVETGEYTEMDFPMIRDIGQDLNVLPNPFTPNGDGINDVVFFLWPAAQGEAFETSIFTLEGVPVRKLSHPEPFWDGQNENGELLSGGLYLFVVEAQAGRVTGLVCLAR